MIHNPSPIAHHSSPPLIDTHCHLDMQQFGDDLDAVIGRAQAAGLEALVTVSSDLPSNGQNIRLCEKYDSVYATVGVHPHDAKDFTDEVLARLSDWTRHAKVVAVGETGLDYHYDHSPREVQREVFMRHLELAKETGMPAVIHSREAKADTLDILRNSGISKGVLHCFSGDRDMAQQVLSLGLMISFAGPVTFPKADGLREIAAIVPDDAILVETDAPYLAPVPFRGKRNEPAFIRQTVEQIASVRGVSAADIARITTLNARRLFGIGTMPERGEIAYPIRDSLYLNITNRCSNRCSFCVKFHSDYVKGHRLRLSEEPDEEQIRAAIGDPRRFREIVFCGYGEPLHRLETVKNISRWVKEQGGRVRINTNGHANLIHRRNVVTELRGLVDSISISLDAQDARTYDAICKPVYPGAFEEVIRFIREAKAVIADVQVTVVNLPAVDLDACRRIAEELGVRLRVRELDVVG